MPRVLVTVVVAIATLSSAGSLAAQQDVYNSAYHDYRVVTVVDALVQPWSIAFLPNGDWLITERPGRLRIVRDGKLLPQSVQGTPKVFTSTQAGLLEVALHPDFATNHFL
jgi:glucose/arabinose dehydrogenase